MKYIAIDTTLFRALEAGVGIAVGDSVDKLIEALADWGESYGVSEDRESLCSFGAIAGSDGEVTGFWEYPIIAMTDEQYASMQRHAIANGVTESPYHAFDWVSWHIDRNLDAQVRGVKAAQQVAESNGLSIVNWGPRPGTSEFNSVYAKSALVGFGPGVSAWVDTCGNFSVSRETPEGALGIGHGHIQPYTK